MGQIDGITPLNQPYINQATSPEQKQFPQSMNQGLADQVTISKEAKDRLIQEQVTLQSGGNLPIEPQ